MSHQVITPSETTIIAAFIGSLGWVVSGRWQHRGAQTSQRIEEKLDSLQQTIKAHTEDEAIHLAEVRPIKRHRAKSRRGLTATSLDG